MLKGNKKRNRFSLHLLEERDDYYFEVCICREAHRACESSRSVPLTRLAKFKGFVAICHEQPEDSGGRQNFVAFSSRRKIEGRLHISAKALFFDPTKDTLLPVQKLPFSEVVNIRPRQVPDGKGSKLEFFVIQSK